MTNTDNPQRLRNRPSLGHGNASGCQSRYSFWRAGRVLVTARLVPSDSDGDDFPRVCELNSLDEAAEAESPLLHILLDDRRASTETVRSELDCLKIA